MKVSENRLTEVNSISHLHRILGLQKPHHPLISVIDLSDIKFYNNVTSKPIIFNMYSIFLKRDHESVVKYGQNYFDFDAGIMSFFSPNQVTYTQFNENVRLEGAWLAIHPDLLSSHSLRTKIEGYGYFSYATNEALYLSEKEERMIWNKFSEIKEEYQTSIDKFSEELIVSLVDLLLLYCNRFYNRQFITHKNINNDLLTKFETLLENYFKEKKVISNGLPTVQYFSDRLNISSNYLSDLLKTLTGRTTQHFIHDKIIAIAKTQLATTTFSVSEIAYELGFEYPQSFNKLFKNKSGISPLQFRKSFNLDNRTFI